jgi:hypothetical protein
MPAGALPIADILRAGSHQPRADRLVHLLIFPAWTEPQSYELFEPWDRSGAYFGVFTTTRDRSAPADDGGQARPRASGRVREVRFELPAERVDPVLVELRNCRVPVLAGPDPRGFDGAFYEARFGYGHHQSVFHWWSLYPAEWRPLVAAVERFVQLCRDYIEFGPHRAAE